MPALCVTRRYLDFVQEGRRLAQELKVGSGGKEGGGGLGGVEGGREGGTQDQGKAPLDTPLRVRSRPAEPPCKGVGRVC